MKKLSYIIGLIIILLPYPLHAFQLKTSVDNREIVIQSHYHRLCSGEVIKISLTSPPPTSAKAHFLGHEYVFVPERGGSTFFILIGLGLDTKPGVKDLDIHIAFPHQIKKRYSFKIPVSARTFPVQRINVGDRFVRPSREAVKRIKKDVAAVNAVYRAYMRDWLGRGNFMIPSDGKIRNNFGERRIYNNVFRSQHRGVDIRSPRGASVRASNYGKVVLTRDLYFAGNTVIIDHGAGLFFVYCHLSEIFVDEGAAIERGHVVGRVGSTGRVTGPHFHWGVSVSGQPVNPLSTLRLSFD